MIQKVLLTNSRGDIVLAASSRELDHRNEFWVDGTPTGWYGGFSMRGENEERLGHGSFPTTRTRSARTLEVKAKIKLASWDHANYVKRQLSAALADGESGELTVEETGVPALTTVVERTGEVLIARSGGPSSFTVSIPLTAPDPELYTPWRETYLHPAGAGVGFDFAPFSRGGVISFGTAVATDDWIWNDGNTASPPQFTVWAASPGFAVGVGDKRVTYPWPTFMDIPVTVDMAGAVTVGGVDQSHLLGERGWASVPPRSIESVHFSFLQGGTGWAIVRHRDINV
ncbi:hypothetical protein HBA56_04200 [Pseudoteredinibacter isoporae]|nr:hypothetical protein [Pseudoteredinibacter isoporae]